MTQTRRSWVFFLAAAIGACAPEAAPSDAGPPDTGAVRADAFVAPDAGPAPNGCDLLDGAVDGGPLGDAGTIDPSAFPPLEGPGGPAVTFTSDQLLHECGGMSFGPTDQMHHNGGFFFDGYLVRAWAHEHGGGGIAVVEMDDPCHPVIVANTLDDQIRETHTVGATTMNGRWIAVASLRGIQFWDLSDILAPRMAFDMVLPGVSYPDAYMRTVMSVFWQAPYVYVGASDNGIFIVDASDPEAPRLVAQVAPEPVFRVGNVHAVGNLLVAMGSENARVASFDISSPSAPRPIPGGSFLVSNGVDALGRPRVTLVYFGTLNGGFSYHARNGLGAGLAIMDLRTPSAPAFVAAIDEPMSAGGYVYLYEGFAFVGLSQFGMIYDVTDPTTIVRHGRIDFTGDLDFMTPLGNVVMVSVDDDAVDHATGIFPWREAPDVRGPAVNWIVPADGATDQPLSTRIGMTFDEFVELGSVWSGSVQVRAMGPGASDQGTPIEGWFSGQDAQVNFWPAHPLAPGTTYEVIVPAGGVTDVSGNPTTTELRASFTTASCE
jgi:hypothetical protein